MTDRQKLHALPGRNGLQPSATRWPADDPMRAYDQICLLAMEAEAQRQPFEEPSRYDRAPCKKVSWQASMLLAAILLAVLILLWPRTGWGSESRLPPIREESAVEAAPDLHVFTDAQGKMRRP